MVYYTFVSLVIRGNFFHNKMITLLKPLTLCIRVLNRTYLLNNRRKTLNKHLMKIPKALGGSLIFASAVLAAGVSLLPGSADAASECYDHWNGDAWHGAAEWAIVLCLDSATMKKCEVRYHNGSKILDLQQHFGLDRGRIIWTDYDVYSFQYVGLFDVVCTAVDNLTYTFTVDNTPNEWWDWGGCGPGTDYGGGHCVNDQNEKTLVVSKAGNGRGSVIRFPQGVKCSSTNAGAQCYHTPGSKVTLTAQPVKGYVFSGWSGACSGSGTCVVTMNAAKRATANFIKFSGTGARSLLLSK